MCVRAAPTLLVKCVLLLKCCWPTGDYSRCTRATTLSIARDRWWRRRTVERRVNRVSHRTEASATSLPGPRAL